MTMFEVDMEINGIKIVVFLEFDSFFHPTYFHGGKAGQITYVVIFCIQSERNFIFEAGIRMQKLNPDA